jgi:hypothetical protein
MTVKQAAYGDLEIVRSPNNHRCIVNPTENAQAWALGVFFSRSDWSELAKCARNLLRLQRRRK